MGRTLVYHGSYTKVQVPKIVKGRNTKDFGSGFYCTTIKEQACRWARRYDTPMVNRYSLLVEGQLKILEFKTMTDEWLDFIISCRGGKTHDYDIVRCLGRETLQKIYDLADVYHSDNIDRVSDDFIAEKKIACGTFDNVAECEYAVPSHWDIGKVYKRLILMISESEQIEIIDALIAAYDSRTSDLIEDYNGSFYYENPQTIFDTYRHGGIPA